MALVHTGMYVEQPCLFRTHTRSWSSIAEGVGPTAFPVPSPEAQPGVTAPRTKTGPFGEGGRPGLPWGGAQGHFVHPAPQVSCILLALMGGSPPPWNGPRGS